MSNTDMIIKSLNDFNKIVDSKYKNGLFALVKEEAILKEVVFIRNLYGAYPINLMLQIILKL